jgi:hypothetical protein
VFAGGRPKADPCENILRGRLKLDPITRETTTNTMAVSLRITLNNGDPSADDLACFDNVMKYSQLSIDWGDGIRLGKVSLSTTYTHTYKPAGEYTIRLYLSYNNIPVDTLIAKPDET